jgi:hypothetical protein
VEQFGRRVLVRAPDLTAQDHRFVFHRTVSAPEIARLDMQRTADRSWGAVVRLNNLTSFWLEALKDRDTAAPSPQWVAMIEEIRGRLGVSGETFLDKPISDKPGA